LVNIPVDKIIPDENNTIIISTSESEGNYSGGSVDDKMFYTFVIQNFAVSDRIAKYSQGCTWEVEFEDGSISYINIPSVYSGSNNCVYKTNTYDSEDALNQAAYNLFNQLDFRDNGILSVKISQDDISASETTVENVPSMLGPSMTQVNIWK